MFVEDCRFVNVVSVRYAVLSYKWWYARIRSSANNTFENVVISVRVLFGLQ